MLSAAGMPPRAWKSSLLPVAMGLLFKYEIYNRAILYGDSYVTSVKYKGSKTRDNQWVVFQHHLHWCAVDLNCISLFRGLNSCNGHCVCLSTEETEVSITTTWTVFA
jgi:hypothetical protein